MVYVCRCTRVYTFTCGDTVYCSWCVCVVCHVPWLILQGCRLYTQSLHSMSPVSPLRSPPLLLSLPFLSLLTHSFTTYHSPHPTQPIPPTRTPHRRPHTASSSCLSSLPLFQSTSHLPPTFPSVHTSHLFAGILRQCFSVPSPVRSDY